MNELPSALFRSIDSAPNKKFLICSNTFGGFTLNIKHLGKFGIVASDKFYFKTREEAESAIIMIKLAT
jgi:hypothetical protein